VDEVLEGGQDIVQVEPWRKELSKMDWRISWSTALGGGGGLGILQVGVRTISDSFAWSGSPGAASVSRARLPQEPRKAGMGPPPPGALRASTPSGPCGGPIELNWSRFPSSPLSQEFGLRLHVPDRRHGGFMPVLEILVIRLNIWVSSGSAAGIWRSWHLFAHAGVDAARSRCRRRAILPSPPRSPR